MLDLQGMGKGQAWVNGQSIGRYWPSFLADNQGCQPCDYRQTYDANKCRTDCGKPSQRRKLFFIYPLSIFFVDNIKYD